MEHVITNALIESTKNMGFWGFILSTAIFMITQLVAMPLLETDRKLIQRFCAKAALLNMAVLTALSCLFEVSFVFNIGVSIMYSALFFYILKAMAVSLAKITLS